MPLNVHFNTAGRDYRIVRHDKLNLALEELRSKKNPNTKETDVEWTKLGYYNPRGLQRAIMEILSDTDYKGDLIGWYKEINLRLVNIQGQLEVLLEWKKEKK